MGLCFDLLDSASALAPRHGLTLVLVRTSHVEGLVERLKEGVMVHVVDILHLFLRDGELVRIFNGLLV